MLDEALWNYVAQLRDQAFIHEHLVKLSFFGVDQKASHCLVQVVEHLFEICCCLHQLIFGDDKIEDLEETMDVAVRNLQSDYRTLYH